MVFRSQRLKLAYDKLLSTFAFNFNLRRYSEEFRRHLEGKTTQEQWITFGSEWSKYLSAIGSVPGEAARFSGDLSAELVNSMTKEQKEKLEELREEALGFGAQNKEVLKDKGEDK